MFIHFRFAWFPLCLTAALMFLSPSLQGETLVLTPSADTSLFQKNPFNNVGGSQSLAAGDTATVDPARALIKFDVAGALPPNVVVTSARLELTIVRTILSAPALFDLHRLSVDWGEGDKDTGFLTGAGQPATTGEASWVTRFYPATVWTQPGGQAGQDYVGTPSSSAALATQGVLVLDSTSMMTADVQGWLENPAGNFGWMLKSRAEFSGASARRFGSREHPESPPRLVVEFQAAGPLIEGIELQDGQLCFRFKVLAGKTYAVQRRSDLALGNWTVITNLPPAAVSQEALICDPLESGPRFYRVEER